MKIKVCGMRDENNILKILEEPPDFIGFIFYEQSSRFVGDISPNIMELIPAYVGKTGVFVNAPVDLVIEKTKTYKLDYIQLHGSESTAYCKELNKALMNLSAGIIKVFNINEEFNFEKLADYEPLVDYFLFDTKGKLPGGNGEIFNWQLLKNYQSKKPFFLSGGIGPEHLEQIAHLNLKGLFAIDVNSKFEKKPAIKNHELTTKFVADIRKISTLNN